MNKNIKKTVFCTIVLVMILFGLFYFWQQPKLRQDVFSFAYGEQVPSDSSSYLKYGPFHEDVTFDAELFSMKELGEYSVEISYENKPYTLQLAIVDKDAPNITFSQADTITLFTQDDKLRYDSLFTIEDMSETLVVVTPDEKTMQEGMQNICVSASDSFGNKQDACKDVTIKIVDFDVQSAFSNQDTSVKEIIESIVKENKLTKQNFSFFYYSPNDKEEYVYNPDAIMNAASTIKVPLNMLYEDLKIQGKVSDKTTYALMSSDIEEGDGETSTDYKIGEAIPLSYIQEQSIINSDNTATNMLIRGLGGFSAFRKLLPQYSDEILASSFYKNNEVTAAYMMDVMKYLYDNREMYATLIENMKQSSEEMYLQDGSDIFMVAQKYGSFNTYLHCVGIVYTPQPYLIGIYTNNYVEAYQLIVDINETLLQYQVYKEG